MLASIIKPDATNMSWGLAVGVQCFVVVVVVVVGGGGGGGVCVCVCVCVCVFE